MAFFANSKANKTFQMFHLEVLMIFLNFPLYLKSFPSFSLFSRQFPIGQDPDQEVHFWIPELLKYQVLRNQDDPKPTSA